MTVTSTALYTVYDGRARPVSGLQVGCRARLKYGVSGARDVVGVDAADAMRQLSSHTHSLTSRMLTLTSAPRP